MMSMLVLIALIMLPAIVLALLRINAAIIFLSLCLGAVLVQFSGDDAVSIMTGASVNAHSSAQYIRLGLLLTPALLTMLFMIKTVSRSKRFLNVLPALGTGLLTAVLVVPLLPTSLATPITRSDLWVKMQPVEPGIVALSTLVCLLFLWLHKPKSGGEEKAGKRHKG
jgi:hypothetical protein